MSRTRTRMSLPGIVAVLALLAGCAIPLPAVEADPEPEVPAPALDQARLDRVLASIGETIAAGDQAQDSTLLEQRLTGSALLTRTAEYALSVATADTDAARTPQVLTTQSQLAVVSATPDWPKVIFVYTTIADGLNTPLLLGLTQADPRANYQLFSWVRLLPGATTPETAVPGDGSPIVAADAPGLVLSPTDAIAGYANVLSLGLRSEHIDSFAPDAFRELIWEHNAVNTDGVEDAGGYKDTFVAVDEAPISLGTADGGAVVIGNLLSHQLYERTIEDSELTVGGQIAALAGSEVLDVADSVTATYYTTVALYVPPAAEGATIQVLGAERVLQTVTGE